MKNSFFHHGISAMLSLALFLSFANLHAQQRNLKTELLVYILPDSLELPADVKTSVNLQRATIRSSALKTALQETRVIGISRAFPNWSTKDSLVTRNDGVTINAPPFHRIFILTFATESEADAAINILQKSTAVLYAEKQSEPVLDNDPSYIDGTQWYLNNDGRNGGVVGADINAEGAWAIFTGDPNSIIAIIDTGVETGHDDLTGKATGETPFGNAHGTLVAGVAAARANNAEGIRGVDWNAQVLSKRHLDMYDEWLGDETVADKIVDAVNENADILNNSWSFPDYSNTLAMAFAYVYKMNRVSVATMGNTSTQETRYPGGLPNVIAVGATQNTDLLSPWSTTGNHIDVVAPGGLNRADLVDARDIWSTTIGNDYEFTSGTSFAAPQVTGLASLLKGFNNNLSNDDIRQIIRLSADKVGTVPYDADGFNNNYGFGRINAGQALNLLQAPNQLFQWNASGGTIFSSTGNMNYQFYGAGSLASGQYVVKRHEVRKTVTFPQSFCSITGVWGRGVSTTGWSDVNPNFGEGFCEVVPGTLTNTAATLRTYIYEVYSLTGAFIGWHPTTASNVTFAYSALGLPNPTGAYITGPTLVCTSGTFAMNNMPANYVYTWSTSSNLSIQSVSGNSVTVSKVSSGSGWVRATITSGFGVSCSSPQSTITFNLHVGGYSSSDYPVSGPSSVCTNEYAYYSTNDLLHATDYAWFWPSDWEYSAGQGTRFLDLRTTSFSTSGVIGVRVANACDAGGSAGTKYTSVSSCGGFSIATYPNPATNELIIESEMVTSETETQTLLEDNDKNSVKEFSVKLRDSNGQIRKSGSTQSGKIVLGVSNFRDGVYYLEIITKETVFLKQVLLKR